MENRQTVAVTVIMMVTVVVIARSGRDDDGYTGGKIRIYIIIMVMCVLYVFGNGDDNHDVIVESVRLAAGGQCQVEQDRMAHVRASDALTLSLALSNNYIVGITLTLSNKEDITLTLTYALRTR